MGLHLLAQGARVEQCEVGDQADVHEVGEHGEVVELELEAEKLLG